jgi:hypothetical protein
MTIKSDIASEILDLKKLHVSVGEKDLFITP